MIQEFLLEHAIEFHIFIIIASLFIMAKAAGFMVRGITGYSRKLGLSDHIVGLLVVAIAASMPELVSSINGAIIGESGIILGTIFGSNLASLALIVGVLALFRGKLNTKSKILKKTNFFIWLLAMMPFFFLLDGQLSRIDGFLLIFSFLIYVVFLWHKEGRLGEIKKNVKLEHIWMSGLIFLLSLVVLMLTARYLVFSSVMLARNLGITPYLIALTVLSIGATMPDFLVSVKSIKHKHQGVGYGNVIGTMVVQALLFLGVIAVIKPIIFEISALTNIIIFRTIMISLLLWWAAKNSLNRIQGLGLILLYAGFIIVQLVLH